MSSSPSHFAKGDAVRVRVGVSDPEYSDLTLGGWVGVVADVKDDLVLIGWSVETLSQIPDIYTCRCERDGTEPDEMWLYASELELYDGRPIRLEPQGNIQTKPLSMNDQDDRIRLVFGLTSDELLPDVDDETLQDYCVYLAKELTFPFDAEYSKETGPFQSRRVSVTVHGFLDPAEFSDEHYGLFCHAHRGKEKFQLPLCDLEKISKPNKRLLDDYAAWFMNYRD